ncbi:MAG: DEAD/DEAH box helicase [Candidatus Eisenbacteria bacterium]|nr:DEAD/DEAH box helicase [Candidatus Eisenbacteria bacterium]
MTLNPLRFSEQVLGDFLRYQVTAFPLADERLSGQLRAHLALGQARRSPLVRGPYVSLSRAFARGIPVADLARQIGLHPHLANLVEFPDLYGHQEAAIRAIAAGRTTLVSTGTGSGKTECFLYPIISRCLALRDQNAPPGIVAVLVYPMNALAEDQMLRVRWLLAGTGIPFGLYVGHTPQRRGDVTGTRLRAGGSRSDYERALERTKAEGRAQAVRPSEERASREEMREPGGQPRILLTNVKQLELLLTRQADVELFEGAALEFLVFDEVHTWGGAEGAEAACLVRRLRAFCGRDEGTVCVGTSATLADPAHGLEPARGFASRFFGVPDGRIEVVTERYRDDDWAPARAWPRTPPGNPAQHLAAVLEAVDERASDGAAVAAALEALTGEALPAQSWEEALHTRLAANELCFHITQALGRPMALDRLVERLSAEAVRAVSEEEVLCWLLLGAAARRDGRPLMRPVVHAFVRGMGGGVVTFEPGDAKPRLAMLAPDGSGAPAERVRLSLISCTTCGQHYFVHHAADLRVTDKGLEGGEAVEERRVFRPLDSALGGRRVVLLDRLIGAGEEPGLDDEPPQHTQPAHLCAHCGALHPAARDRCDACGRAGPLVALLAVEHGEKRPGQLGRCLSCAAPGRPVPGGWREPARPVRAVAVADVHVLAQNMVHRAERRRLLVFADNRQDAAFQAGWMRDRARRFRLRALMMQRIAEGPLSVGDLVAHLDARLDRDDEESRALLPEVWAHQPREAAGVAHQDRRRWFLRVLVLRELATGVKQRLGLEPWGRIEVRYLGLDAGLPFIQRWSARLGLAPERLVDGACSLLDAYRRSAFLIHDAETRAFSKRWREGDEEIQRGYLPFIAAIPKGLKLERDPGDDDGRLDQWLSARGDTRAKQAARAFGVPRDDVEEFLRDLWACLTVEVPLLVPVDLTWSRGGVIARTGGARQIDGGRLLVAPHRGRWRCTSCRRSQVRPTPNDRCLAWHCDGTLVHIEDDPDDYDLLALDQQFAMLRPAEHSAQVPHDVRERLERWFKGEEERVNALVCTPTLELGVDIGGLDSVLMRNVPPTPANYWQRVGRAGRQHRLAVNLTYARDVSHDRQYFADPLRLLEGRVEPPRFNLRNEVMLGKHVRAAAITRLRRLARDGSRLADEDRRQVAGVLDRSFPTYIRDYLFTPAGSVRPSPFDVSDLRTVVTKHAEDLVAEVEGTFRATWPEDERDGVAGERLRDLVLGTADELESVLARLRRRLEWSLARITELNREEEQRGTLDEDQMALRRRCQRVAARLKGVEKKARRESEGYDDRYTFGALAAEGFFPGYGLEAGTIRAYAQPPRFGGGVGEFTLTRPPVAALREYVPGNLIYANGGQFAVRFYHFEATEPLVFVVDAARGAVREAGLAGDDATTLGADRLKAVPVCDCDLSFRNPITDDQDHRFQLPVAVYGEERSRHGGGTAFDWGARELQFRCGQYLRLVNVGAASLVEGRRLGFPMSIAGSQCRSPFASERELQDFAQTMEERYGRPWEWCGFYADIVADALMLQDAADRTQAYSVLEALRTGMANLLEMDREDLEILVVARPGEDLVDGFLYDPMPGGSGLLEQACERWAEVVQAALEVVEGCPAGCARSCIDCLQVFRNAYYHEHLDRSVAAARLRDWGGVLAGARPIPPRMPAEAPRGAEAPTNVAEDRLRHWFERGGLPEPEWQKPVDLGAPLGGTTPDAFFPMEAEPGLCVYVDGLSGRLHGDPARAAQDRVLRAALRSRGFVVIEIPASHLEDREAMRRHLATIARWLLGPDASKKIREAQDWA